MPTWNAAQYLKFKEERTQPCRDLAARINVANTRRVIDLGCGPGNSTQVLAERWPDAEIYGLDSSAEMIGAARAAHSAPAAAIPQRQWMVCDLSAWAAADICAELITDGEKFDVVFSNAALQWVPNHETLLPRVFNHVSPAGAMAFQMPAEIDCAAHRFMRELAASPAWRNTFTPGTVREWHSHEGEFYYDLLSPLAARVDMWQTEYFHALPGAEEIVEWYQGTGLRPYLDAISGEAAQQQFLAEYLEAIRPHYPRRADGRVRLPFLRIFLIAYR
jgi:trans-aconitate 2-methyltransferase